MRNGHSPPGFRPDPHSGSGGSIVVPGTRFLLDTDVLSQTIKHEVPGVEAWLMENLTNCWISAVSLAEIEKGLECLRNPIPGSKAYTMAPPVRRKTITRLENWIDNWVLPSFDERVVYADMETNRIWGRLCAKNPEARNGNDMLISATAIRFNMMLVTMNVRDHAPTGVRLYRFSHEQRYRPSREEIQARRRELDVEAHRESLDAKPWHKTPASLAAAAEENAI